MMKPSWICTVVTQLSLCFALFLVLNLGEPQKHIINNKRVNNNNTSDDDFYFISVTGGYRPLHQQTLLLKQIKRVAKAYKAAFIVNVSEFGEDDPLSQNATGSFSSTKLPWYTTKASMGQPVTYFKEQIKLPRGKILEIIGVNSRFFQVSPAMKSSGGYISSHYSNLAQMLMAKSRDWSIVIGHEPLVNCEENKEQIAVKPVYKPLHDIFMKCGVDVYLSREGCTNFARLGNVAYIGNPGLIKEKPSVAASSKGGSVVSIAMADGFLLHRVTSLEIVSIQSLSFQVIPFLKVTYFVNLATEVVYMTVVQQGGKAVM
ncbi:hypothetical protein ACFE04_000884 [Oxalis oulophora]